jgi:hypothetical protein
MNFDIKLREENTAALFSAMVAYNPTTTWMVSGIVRVEEKTVVTFSKDEDGKARHCIPTLKEAECGNALRNLGLNLSDEQVRRVSQEIHDEVNRLRRQLVEAQEVTLCF